jgi:hypothetical protein
VEEVAVFQRLLRDAKSAAASLLLKYVARASVAVPFVIALGFALAAVTVMLVQRFGHATAYWIMAGGLAVIGVLATATIAVKEHEDEVAEQQAERTAAPQMVSEVVAQAPLALLGALFNAPGGASSALAVARLLVRHFPLVVLVALIGVLVWPTGEEVGDAAAPYAKPNGLEPGAFTH